MAENSAQEKTEAPTARRLNKAIKDGEVARSVELPAAVVVIGTLLLLLLTGPWLIERLAALFAQGFALDLRSLRQPELMISAFGNQLLALFLLTVPLLVYTLVAAVISSGMTGGHHFSLKAVQPKASKLNLISGLKRMFGVRAAVELGKAIMKFALVATVLWISIMNHMDTLMQMGRMHLEPALTAAAGIILESAVWVALSLAFIAMIDVPYQKHAYMKRMRMTKQEVKDEFKEMEGRPEVKAQIRRRQREMANNRMMQRIKDADVIITNPQHFAVALEYDPSSDGAPVMVAKGADLMAARIREEAETHGIHIFEAPPLARAIYFTTDLEQAVPEDLYHAVAQVIAYVFSLEGAAIQGRVRPRPQVKVPPNMLFNADGRPMNPEGVNA
ncbi:MAG: flagellar biosynthesis protein FlhB [Quisquiliibacterium sp.]